jgi:tRNA A-37 threonylcarbamoyl transferase component Bud32
MEPQKIGRYEIKAELGRGGMATVYQAYDPRFEREVAIKVLPREMLHDPQFRVRFEREAKTIAMLDHPAIVPVYDFGEEDGQPYFVMRFMNGGSLSDRLKNGPIPLSDVARLYERLAPALDEAHAKGIIHRDLKPGNILFDQHDEPYISDFGIAKLSESQTNVTGSAIVGTPAYMSPEQAQGEGIDGRSDIYGMGVILFEMLTGQQPYQGDTPMSVVVKHITDPVPHILDVKPDLPPATEGVIEKAMAKNRDERFPTVKAIADALNAVARGEAPDLTVPAVTSTGETTPAMTRVSKKAGAKAVSELEATVMAKRDQKALATEIAAPVRKSTAWIGIVVAMVIVLALAGTGIFIFRDKIPFLAGPAPTQTRLATLAASTLPVVPPTQPPTSQGSPTAKPTEALVPTVTPTTEASGLPVLGGADQIAFLNGNNVWVMNVDGSNLHQLTDDGAAKSELQWTPDGQSVVYLSGTLVQMVSFAAKGLPSTISSFLEAKALDAFEISPNGKNVAISLNHELFVVPFDLAALAKAHSRLNLIGMKGCFQYGTNPNEQGTYEVRWSSDGSKIAVGILGVDAGRQVDLVRVFDVGPCADLSNPVKTLDTFPGARFTMIGYNAAPRIPDFDWNGAALFLLNSSFRNKVYGYQYVYNMDTFLANQLNPLGGAGCCYSDMHWSPDGSYVIFGYQDYNLADKAPTELYYIPYGTISAGGTHTPFALPPGFFKNPREYPDPALRPATK